VVIDVIKVKTATIASGGSLSGLVQIDEAKYIGIVMPSEWTAADLTFQVSMDGSEWVDLYDDTGAEVTVTAGANRAIGIDVASLALTPWQYITIRSGTSALAVNQAAARTLYVVCKW
jgi:hypothetical protein